MCAVTIDAYACGHGFLRVWHCEKRKATVETITRWEDLGYLFRSLLNDDSYDFTLKCLDTRRQIQAVPMAHEAKACKERGPCNKQRGDTRVHYWNDAGKEIMTTYRNDITVTYDHEDEHQQRRRRR
jgi:hypothetical protein